MQHQEALRTIRQLGPELSKEAAEDVLLRHANVEDLAPAQLEKLAQTYNMARQLSHIDASEDRGTTCHQIDTVDLLSKYASEKSAPVAPVVARAQPTHDSTTIDLMRQLRQEITPIEKAAAVAIEEPVAATEEVTGPMEVTAEQIKDAAWDAKVDLYMCADSILKMASCEGRHLQIEVAERDALRQYAPKYVTGALDWLEKYAAAQRISRLLTRHTGVVKAAAFHLTSPLADKIVELAQTFFICDALHKFATANGVDAGEIPATPLDDAAKARAAEDAVAAGLLALTGGTATAAAPAEGGLGAAQAVDFVPPRRDRDDDRDERGGGGGKGGGKDGDTKDSEKAAPSGSHWLAKIIGGATGAVGATGRGVGAVGDAAKGTVRAITDKERMHADQMKVDRDIADIKRSILIRRIAATDPVLRDMPFAEVLATYNAIAETNPEVASNPKRVLLAIREAASYEGVTLDAQKQLTDVRGATGKAESQDADNARRRYVS